MLLWETGEKRYYMVFLLFPPLIHRAPFVFLTCAFLGLEETIGRVGNWQSNSDGNPFQFHMKWTFEHSFILTLPHFNISFYVPFFRPWIRASFFKQQQHIVCIPNRTIPSNEGWWHAFCWTQILNWASILFDSILYTICYQDLRKKKDAGTRTRSKRHNHGSPASLGKRYVCLVCACKQPWRHVSQVPWLRLPSKMFYIEEPHAKGSLCVHKYTPVLRYLSAHLHPTEPVWSIMMHNRYPRMSHRV